MPKTSKGLTLLELLAVIVIIGVILAVAFPRITLHNDIYLDTRAREIAGFIRYLNETAITRKVYYRLFFNLDENTIRTESSGDGKNFEEVRDHSLRAIKVDRGVAIFDVVLPGLGKVDTKEVSTLLVPFGASEPFNLHLKGGERFITLFFNPFTGKVKISDGYI